VPQHEPPVRRSVPVLQVLGSITSLQLGAALASRLFDQVGALGASLLRLNLSAVILTLLERPRIRTWTSHQRRAVLALGCTLAAMNTAFYGAVARLPLGAAITIEFLGPLGLAAVLSRRRRDALWVILALAGVTLLGLSEQGTADGLDPVGVVLALVAALFWAGYIVTGARVATQGPARGGLAGASLVAAALTVPFGLAQGGRALLEPHVLGLGLAMAVLASVIPYTLELRALRHLQRKTFSILVALEPAVGSVVGFVLLDQRLGPASLLAIALVVAAGIGATVTAEPPQAPAPLGGG
jgi:inner membrane transporter RhtA